MGVFATVGLAFMFYAESAAVSARAYNDSMTLRSADMEPEYGPRAEDASTCRMSDADRLC